MSRFNFPPLFRTVVETAMAHNVIDVWDVVEMTQEHGEDFRTIVGEILEAAFSGHHTEEGRKKHAAVADAANAYSFDRIKNA